jgi:hypothetical protein
MSIEVYKPLISREKRGKLYMSQELGVRNHKTY